MKRRTQIRAHVAAFCLLAFVAPAHAGGFQMNEHSARGTGMGGAMTAAINDVTSLHLNPATLSFLRGTRLSIGTTIMVPDTRFLGVAPDQTTTRMQSQVLFPPNFYLAHTFDGGFSFGIGATIPYASRNEWNEDWIGGRVATRMELRSVYVMPTISVPLSDRLAIGASLNVVSSRLQLARRVGLPGETNGVAPADGTESLDGSATTAFGYQIGALLRPGSNLSMGVAYRSRVTVNVPEGKVSYAGIPGLQREQFPDGAVGTSIKTPDNIHGGIGWQPFSWFYVEGDVEYAMWSSLKSLRLMYADRRLVENPALVSSIPLLWRNTFAARCGVELRLPGVLVRLGYHRDQTPVPDATVRPSLPDADSDGFSAGIGYNVGDGLDLDFAYLLVKYKDRNITSSRVEYLPGQYFNGKYASTLSVIGINVSYSWN